MQKTSVIQKQKVSLINVFLLLTVVVSSSVILGSFFAAGLISTQSTQIIKQKEVKVKQSTNSTEQKTTSTPISATGWDPEEIKIMDKNKVVVEAFDFEGDDVLSKDIVIKGPGGLTLIKSDVDKLHNGILNVMEYYYIILKYNNLFNNKEFVNEFDKIAAEVGMMGALDVMDRVKSIMSRVIKDTNGAGIVIKWGPGGYSVGVGSLDGSIFIPLHNSNQNSNNGGSNNSSNNQNSSNSNQSSIVPCLIACDTLVEGITDIINSMEEITTTGVIEAFVDEVGGENTFTYQLEEVDSNEIDLSANLVMDKLNDGPGALDMSDFFITNQLNEFSQQEIDAIIEQMEQEFTEIKGSR